jgi:RNA polymerase sigma-70 factor (ECF subfamily)
MLVTSRQKFVARVYSILRNIDDAEDAVQNAFISGYLHLHNFQGRSTLKTWFTRIVLNAALMIRRKRKPVEPVSTSDWTAEGEYWMDGIPSPEADPEMRCAKAEELEVIRDVSARLNPHLREAFSIYYAEDMSVHQASLITGVSTSTFKARLFRARRKVISGAKRALRPQKRVSDIPSLSAAY